MEQKRIIPYIAAGAVYIVSTLFGTGCASISIDTEKRDVESSQISCSPVSPEALEVASELYDSAVTSLDFESDKDNLEKHPGALCELVEFRDIITGELVRAEYHISDKNISTFAVNAMLNPVINPDYVAPTITPTLEQTTIPTEVSNQADFVRYTVSPGEILSSIFWEHPCLSGPLQEFYQVEVGGEMVPDYAAFEQYVTSRRTNKDPSAINAGEEIMFLAPAGTLESCLN